MLALHCLNRQTCSRLPQRLIKTLAKSSETGAAIAERMADAEIAMAEIERAVRWEGGQPLRASRPQVHSLTTRLQWCGIVVCVFEGIEEFSCHSGYALLFSACSNHHASTP